MEEIEKSIKNFDDENGENHIIIAECNVQNRSFVITADKKIFEKDKDGKYKECSEKDEVTKFLGKAAEPPESLDIER